MSSLIDILPVLLAGLSSLILFINKKWRWNILAMAVIYVSVFWMVLQVWSTGLAVVKLIAGWIYVNTLDKNLGFHVFPPPLTIQT